MTLPPSLLNDWLERHGRARFNLARSTGPHWTWAELLRVGNSELDIATIPLTYAPTQGGIELRQAIAAYHNVDQDWVVVTTGASEAFLLLLTALGRPGGKILVPRPAYPGFAGVAQIAHLLPTYYSLDRENGFSLDLDKIREALDGETLLVVANSPQNPTGGLLDCGSREGLAALLASMKVPLLVDEVFHPVYFGAANSSAAGSPNVVVIGDMSKALSLPGLRIGWVIDPDSDRRERIIRARSYTTISASPVLEALALHALLHRNVILERVNIVASRNLEQLRQFMDDVRETLDWVPPRAGLFAFPWFRDGRDSSRYCELLAANGVAIAPGACFGAPEHIRVCFGSQSNGIAEALEVMRREMRTL
jgi:aspartate/methionine/tyrosine aminotransferase